MERARREIVLAMLEAPPGNLREDCTMVSLTRAKKIPDIEDLYDQFDSLREYVQELSASMGKSASRRYGRARDFASEAARETEEAMKDNLAASLILAVGLGVLLGYFLRRSTE
jgi:hypothetical protein